MLKFFKKLRWLIKNQEKLAALIEKKTKNEQFSIAGVPDYQLDYINDILEAEKK